ncbi:hypothetical protein SMAC4_14002 [Sordaria macrospora]|uniref:uncharacterized protein n=1 Tax=Sordaria macrospora TaxID=5147 RepID=UPI002B2EFADD|nr:hypothetical protein SMAC4_14002 [Sordaria macrospora]
MGVRDVNSRPPTPLSTDLSVGRCAGSGAEEARIQSPHRKSRAPSLASIDQSQVFQMGDKDLSSESLDSIEAAPGAAFHELLTEHVASSRAMKSQRRKE